MPADQPADNAMGLSLKVLGEFALRSGTGEALSLPTRKTRALLGYLAFHGNRVQPRERLMSLLWSDRGERQARQSLNQALMSIRRLGEARGVQVLVGNAEHVALSENAMQSDIRRFRTLLPDEPAKAAAFYRGPFLDGLSVRDPAFDDWVLTARSELHRLACDALERASDLAAQAGASDAAIGHVQRLLALDPLREAAHRRLMQLLNDAGDRAGALRQYRICADLLEQDLQVSPDAATTALYDRIRQDDDKRPRAAAERAVRHAPAPEPSYRSIAVLPFDALSDDPVIDDLVAGLLEDLITALAKVQELHVVDRHTAESHRSQGRGLQELAAKLGVRYILTGSLRKAGDRIRCSVQLIDAASGRHLWAERYDELIEDIFALQDKIVWNVLIELQVKLTEGDTARAASRGTRNLNAWLLRVQGSVELGKLTREGIVRARDLFEAARAADPDWARPLAGIAYTHFYEARLGWSGSRQDAIETGIAFAERAIEMDPNEAFGYQALRGLRILLNEHENALALARKAATLAPSDQLAVGSYAITLFFMDRIPEAIESFERVKRIGPTMHRFFQRGYGLALLRGGQIDRAVAVLEELVREQPQWMDGLVPLAAAYVEAGRRDEARETTRRILDTEPSYTTDRFFSLMNFQDPEVTAWLRRLVGDAGL